jgi:hypothetical protein
MSTTPHLHRWILVVGTSLLAACSGGGGGSDGGTGGSLPGGGGAATRSATLAWSAASGPVNGYRVYVSRNGGGYAADKDVSTTRATVTGESGDRVRVQVAALDSKGDPGPLSPPSAEIRFTDTGATTAAATTAASTSGTSGTATRTAAVSTSTRKASSDTDGSQEGSELPSRGGDGASELLWEGTASGAGMRLTGLASGAGLAFERPTGWRIAGRGDFDGDGRADLLWESGAGELAISTRAALAGSAPATPLAPLGALGPDEVVIATGDLDGDGLADLLVQGDTTGARSVWLLNPGGGADVAVLGAGASPRDHLAATGDFDGDGRTDLLWRAEDGSLSIQFMAGAVAFGSLALPAGAAPEALATGDFDGDGDDDLVRRDAGGTVGVLLMGGRQQPVASSVPVDAGAGWQVAGSGDFDGDGAADLVWVSTAATMLGFHTGAAPEYVPIDPGDGWQLVSFAP